MVFITFFLKKIINKKDTNNIYNILKINETK